MRWMMYRWWCEGGGDSAWWVIQSVVLRSPDKGFSSTCLGDLPPDMPGRLETWFSLCNLMLKLRGISHSTAIHGSDSPQSNIRKGISIRSPWRLVKATSAYTSVCADSRAALAPQLSGRTRVRHWQSSRRLWPDTRRLQLPLDDCCRPVLPCHSVQHATDGTDP